MSICIECDKHIENKGEVAIEIRGFVVSGAYQGTPVRKFDTTVVLCEGCAMRVFDDMPMIDSPVEAKVLEMMGDLKANKKRGWRGKHGKIKRA